MAKFNPILRKPGEAIRSEDWNKMQDEIRADLEEIEREFQELKDYVDSMEQSATLLKIDSLVGRAYSLDDVMLGETSSYESPVVGFLTKQWLLPMGETGEICRFSVVACLESLDYWAGAEHGDKNALEITFSYLDGTLSVVSELFIHDRMKLRPRGKDNPYMEYLLSPNEDVWYRYRVANPHPEKEVLTVGFKNTIPECILRIGNAIHYRSKITPSKTIE